MSRDRDQLLPVMVAHINAWNNHNLDGLLQLFSPDGVFEASGGPDVDGQRFEGKQALRAAFASVFEAMPDAHWGDGLHHVINPGYGVSEWTLTGTRADGNRLEVNGCDFLTVRGGLIIRKNSYRKQRPPFTPTSSP